MATYFNNDPDMLLDASIEDFLKISGVGTKLADALFEALHFEPLQSEICQLEKIFNRKSAEFTVQCEKLHTENTIKIIYANLDL